LGECAIWRIGRVNPPYSFSGVLLPVQSGGSSGRWLRTRTRPCDHALEERQGVGDHAVALILERLVADLVCPDSGADRFVDGEHAPLIRGSRVAAVSGKEFVFESVVVSPLLGCQSP
jgi:hypothetical protein